VLSVLPFDDRTRIAELGWLRKGLADMVVDELANNPSLMVIQRERVEEILREQAFQLSGRVADESAARVGQLAGATVLMTGSLAAADGQVRLDAQLLSVERGIVLGAATAEGPVHEVNSVAQLLVTRVKELLPPFGPSDGSGMANYKPDFLPGAHANATGETLARQGLVFEALEEFERALRMNPEDVVARGNYTRAIQRLSGSELLQSGAGDSRLQDERLANRMIERLAGGIEVAIGRAVVEPSANGVLLIRVPVGLRLGAPSVAAVLNSLEGLRGTIRQERGADGGGPVLVSLHQDLAGELARQLATPRRIFLRLLDKHGRTIGIYSGYRDWRLSNWVSPVAVGMRIEQDKSLASEAVFRGLTPEQVEAVASVKVSVEPVPRERATVRVDFLEQQENRDQLQQPGGSEGVPTALSMFEAMVIELWSPPVTERPWSPGHLPSNERRALVTFLLEKGWQTVREAPRLARSSGEVGFDQAALASVQAAPPGSQSDDGDAPHLAEPPIKVRAQFQVRQDLPALNLIGSRELSYTLAPVPSSGVRR
jgi:TolB-like protein